MCDDDRCTTPTVDKWQTFNNDTLSIDIKEGIPLASKYLAAITSGKVIGSHKMKILICGTEIISLDSSVAKKYQDFVGGKTVTLDIAGLFKNSDATNCPITSYALVSSSNAPLSGVEATLVTLTGSSLSIKYTTVKTVLFYAVAKTASG